MKIRILAILIIKTAMITSLTACSAVNDIKAVGDTGKAFMSALETAYNTTSWSLLAPNIQDEVGGESAWSEVDQHPQLPEVVIYNTEVSGDTAQMDGTAELNNYEYAVTLIFEKIDEGWLITGINFE
jgi:hypothetical protein